MGAGRRRRNRHQESEKMGAGKGKGIAKPHALKATEQMATQFGDQSTGISGGKITATTYSFCPSTLSSLSTSIYCLLLTY